MLVKRLISVPNYLFHILFLVPAIMTALQKYHCPENVSKLIKEGKDKDISVIHLNAVSLVANFDTISNFLEGLNFPDVICISETRLKNDKIDWQLQLVGLPNYDLHYDNSPSNAGGVAIYIKSSLDCKVRPNVRIDIEDCESIFVEISPNSDSKNAKSKQLKPLGHSVQSPKRKHIRHFTGVKLQRLKTRFYNFSRIFLK